MPLTKPLNNNVLIEVQKDHAAVSRSDETESMKYGKLIDFKISQYHLTASAGLELDRGFIDNFAMYLSSLVGKIVRWEEYAEGGQMFEEDGKTYALIPWWRLIGFKEADDEK